MIYLTVRTSGIISYTKEVLPKISKNVLVLNCYIVSLVAFQAHVRLGCYTLLHRIQGDFCGPIQPL